MKIQAQLDDILHRYEELTRHLSEPDAASDAARFQTLMKEQSKLEPVVSMYTAYRDCLSSLEDAQAMLEEETDAEMRAMLKEEAAEARKKLPQMEEQLEILLLPQDPDDEKSVIIEIRAGVGGDEAALFAADLYRLYTKYAEARGWHVETTEVEDIGIGGIKNVSFLVEGKGVYSRLKYESGVHRVQRVPETESGGRIHTSAATVAVMPEAEEVEVSLDLNDCRFDVFRSTGHGGQSVNTTDSAVRLTHMPTGIVISCQDEKSQLKNKDKALKVLRAKLYELEKERRHSEEDALRRSQIGSGDRSEKIRTYNFPQGRVTDHRIKLTLYKIAQVMDGDLDELVDALTLADQTAKLAGMGG